jgi:tRNA dimethylallyltransferase
MLYPDLPAPLVVILGPTAVGKTEVALQLAERLGGEIVSADSRLFYRGMDIGTAKPSQTEMARVPHHLIDVANPDEVWSLALFQQAARQAIEEVQQHRHIPLLVGGTGQYIRAVIEGWHPPVQQPDPRLRDTLEKWAAEIGPFELHHRMAVLDAEAGRTIQPQNVRRTIRALEVIFCTGEKFSVQRQRQASPYSLLLIGLNRPRMELYARVDARIDAMIAAGFQDEVRCLLSRGYSPDLPPFSAIGYREMIAYLGDKMTLEEAVEQMKSLTHQFVRRQANWFKTTDPNIRWFEMSLTVVDEVESFIRSGSGWQPPG